MGAWEQGLAGTSPGITHRLEIDEIGYDINGNYSTVRISHYARTNSGTRTGSYDANEVLDGSTKRSVANVAYNWNTGFTLLFRGDYNIGHDANGYRDVGGSAYLNYAFASGTINGAISLTRLPLAPPITSVTVDTVQPTSIRVGIEIGGFGHGTAAAMRAQYKESSSGTWLDTPDQNDVGGYNYFTITGLIPGTSYDYRAVAYNNNGDQSVSGPQTVSTLPAPNSSAVLFKVIGLA